jgi:hypothetical protein
VKNRVELNSPAQSSQQTVKFLGKSFSQLSVRICSHHIEIPVRRSTAKVLTDEENQALRLITRKEPSMQAFFNFVQTAIQEIIGQVLNGQRRKLAPISEKGAKFLREYYRGYTHQPIRADYGLEPNWQTTVKISPDELVQVLRDEDELVGVRPGEETNQLAIDVDLTSTNYPKPILGEIGWEPIEGIRDVLLTIGLESKLFYSSENQGIHVRVFLPVMVNSLHLGAAVEYALRDAGYELKNGELELSPRIKDFTQKGEAIKLQQAFRLPMQRGGAYIGIGHEVEERADRLDHLVEIIQENSEEQDMDRLKEAMAAAYARLYEENGKKFRQQAPVRGKAAQFKESMELRMVRGFDGKGQTNELMKEVLKYGYIFLHLTGQELVDWLVGAMEAMPGYKQYCGHQHEMLRKAIVWQRWIEKPRNRYYPYGGKGISQKEQAGETEERVNKNEGRAAEAKVKLRMAVNSLEKAGKKFTKVTELLVAIKAEANRSFSDRTLYKPEYRAIWEKLLVVVENAEFGKNSTVRPELAPTATLPTFEETKILAQKFKNQNQPPEPSSEYYPPQAIECLADFEAERPKASAASIKLILGKMRVSDVERAETLAKSEIVSSDLTEEAISRSVESNGCEDDGGERRIRKKLYVKPETHTPSAFKAEIESTVLAADQLVTVEGKGQEPLEQQINIQQLNLLEIITNANSAPSIQTIFKIWISSYAQAKAVVDQMSKEAMEPFETTIYEREILAERLRVVWASVPPSWADFVRGWFERLKIDPGWPPGYSLY